MKYISRIVSVTLTVGMTVFAISAQKQSIAPAASDKYVISAKAGGVNLVEGTVGIVRKFGKSGILLRGDRLEIGDRVSTAANGKAEILLNPGSYLRLGGNSAFEFQTTSLDDLELRLDSGSAILEVFAADDFKVTVNAPNAKFSLIESGIYRIDVDGSGGKIAVWKGRAETGAADSTVVKKGREAIVSGSQIAVAKFDRDEKDGFELWSKTRAKELAKISSNLARREMRTSLMQSFLGRRWNMYNSFGLWVYDPFRMSHCFLPFGYGWNSPYGYGFGQSIYSFNLPNVIYQYPDTRVTDSNTKPPPFVRMQGTSGSTGFDMMDVKPPAAGDTPIRSGQINSAPTRMEAPVRSEPTQISNTKRPIE